MTAEITPKTPTAFKFHPGALWWSMPRPDTDSIRYFLVLDYSKELTEEKRTKHYVTVQEIPAQTVTLSNGDTYIAPNLTAPGGEIFTAEVTRNSRFTHTALAVIDGANAHPWNGDMFLLPYGAQ